MESFADRLKTLETESDRIGRYLRDLPPAALAGPTACAQWNVRDVVAHLIGVAETYAGSIDRGLAGDTAPPPGRLPAGQATASLAADGIAQRALAVSQSLGERVLTTFEATGTQLNRALADLRPPQRATPCYHPGGLVAAEQFIELRLKELAVHEWDIRAPADPDARLSAASLPAILTTIFESIASGSLRWAFWAGPALAAPVRYRFVLSGPGARELDVAVDGATLRLEAAGGAPDVTLACDSETFVLLVYGRLDLASAIATGRLTVTGDAALARAFGQWFRGI
jgi:uncharacterized protein (TIGR03083 family)